MPNKILSSARSGLEFLSTAVKLLTLAALSTVGPRLVPFERFRDQSSSSW